MKYSHPSISKLWLLLFIAAAAAVIVAFVLWRIDGAWEYGSMPTKGLIRTTLFATGGMVCLSISILLRNKNREN